MLLRHRGEQHCREALEHAQQRNDHLVSIAGHAQKVVSRWRPSYLLWLHLLWLYYYGYTSYGDAHPEGEPLPVVVTARGLKGVHSREHAVPQGQHLARRVGHGAETARLGDAVRGVRAGLAAARLVPQCGGERAEVVRDGLLRLGSGLGFG